jgi:hypothetical protein
MIIWRAYIENKAVTRVVYWGETSNPEDTTYVEKMKAKIIDKFPNETFPYPIWVIGTELGNDSNLSIHQCSVDSDSLLSKKLANTLLVDKDYIVYNYDLNTVTKTYEVFYKPDQAYSVVPLGSGVSIYRISDTYDQHFNNLGRPCSYVQGSVEDVFAWARSIDPNVVLPISEDKLLHEDDTFRFEFTTTGNLVSVSLFTHLQRTMVWNQAGTDTYVEYTADFADELTNANEAGIVIPKYDNHGNRVASDTVIENIEEYILVPVKGQDGQYTKQKLSEI